MMRLVRRSVQNAVLGVVLVACASRAHADVATLTCAKDNTLIELAGDPSNALGDGLYVGNTSRAGRRRGVMMFNTSPIPAGSTVTAVTVEVALIQTSGVDGPAALHKLQADWGEGTSAGGGGSGAPASTGDATWVHRFFNTDTWTTPGGDFNPAASATTTIASAVVAQSFASTPALVADVQGWVNTPSQNFGWIFIGDEEGVQTARRFASREYLDPMLRPRVVVTFTPPPPTCPADFNNSGTLSVQDIFDFLAAYFGGLPSADFNQSGGVSVQDIFDYLAAYFAGCP